MDYMKLYYDIILRSKDRGLNKSKLNYYTEKHHIIPKCYFKSEKAASYKENLVLLTAREHYLCHYFLWKNCKSDNRMFLAYYRILKGNKIKYSNVTSKQYEILKINFSNYLRNFKTGKNNPNFGKKFSKDICLKMSVNHADFKGEQNPMFNVHRLGEKAPNFGNKHTDDTKKRISETKIGNTYRRKQCVINGKHYASLTYALKEIKISMPTLIFRLKSEKFENYFYI
jgi:hypothetical protein